MTNWVLVSGAGTGIGRAISLKMMRRGFSPILMGRNEETLQETAALVDGAQHRLAVCDIRNALSVREALAATGIEAIHGVVANAGIGGENNYGDEDRWDEIITTNLTGTYITVNEAMPYLNAAREESEFRHLIFISSILARLGVPGYTAYCASKAGLLGLMRSYAAQYAGEKILANAICPGWVGTTMAKDGLDTFAQANGRSYDEEYEAQMATVPLGKMSEPREIAELVFFLLSRVQGSITGQTLDMNNGAFMA